MQTSPKTVDYRMESFVARFGQLPPGARRLEDFEARDHGASWIRRLLGQGVACNYVIGYAHAAQWWTFCFDRQAAPCAEGDAEAWLVEAYDSSGFTWSDTFFYAPDEDDWYHLPGGNRLLFIRRPAL